MHHPDFSTARHTPPLFPLRAGSVPGGHVTANATAEGRPQPAAEDCALLPPFLPPQRDRGETGKSKGEKGLGSRKSQFNKQRGRKEKKYTASSQTDPQPFQSELQKTAPFLLKATVPSSSTSAGV